jgi:hypothetical protein
MGTAAASGIRNPSLPSEPSLPLFTPTPAVFQRRAGSAQIFKVLRDLSERLYFMDPPNLLPVFDFLPLLNPPSPPHFYLASFLPRIQAPPLALRRLKD